MVNPAEIKWLDRELQRKERDIKTEEQNKTFDAFGYDIHQLAREKFENSPGTEQEKFVRYRLNDISPVHDKELYYVLYQLLMDNTWKPSDYQLQHEDLIFQEIGYQLALYCGNNVSLQNELYSGSGEVLLYFAKRLAYDTGLSIAGACTMLLSNCGIDEDLYTADSGLILSYYHLALSCDENPEPENSLFGGPDYWDYHGFNSSFYVDGKYMIPTWWEAYEVYLDNLMNGKK